MATIRQKLIGLLEEGEIGAREISQAIGIREKEVYDHLTHISRSASARNRKLSITPARCISCDFTFKERKKFTRPGKCPRCRSERISEPLYRIE